MVFAYMAVLMGKLYYEHSSQLFTLDYSLTGIHEGCYGSKCHQQIIIRE